MPDTERIRHLEQQVATLKEANNAMSDAYNRGRKEGRLELATELEKMSTPHMWRTICDIITKHEEEACRIDD